MGRREIGLALIGLLMGAAIFIVLLSPRITSISPIDPSETAWPEITIHFNRPIDESSLTDRFHFSPAIDGEILVNGDLVSFRPAEALDYGQVYTVTIQPGIRGTNGLPLIQGTETSFETTGPRLAFLLERDGSSNLWTIDDYGNLQPLTSDHGDIWNFEPLSDGRGILYSVFDDEVESGLRLLDPSGNTESILDCLEDDCHFATWQPGGSLIAYERQPSGGSKNDTEVWLLDTNAGQTWPAHDTSLLDNQGFDLAISQSPRWSTDGRYLSYYKPDARVVVVIDMEGGPADLLPVNLEIMGDWSPIEYKLAFSELVFGQQFENDNDTDEANPISNTQPSLYYHTILADFELDQTSDIGLGQEANDGQPAWHPTGDLLATSRSVTGSGRQIWLLPKDGIDAYSITDNPLYNHTAIQWSPDGRQLAYMRTSLADGSVPEIWTLNIETGQNELVVEGGYLPRWLP